MNEKPLVIALCDYTGHSVESWAEAGYECWIVDTQHPRGVGELRDGIRKIGCDIRDFQLPEDREIAFMFAWPPCTHLAVSGARWFKGKGLDLLADGIRLVAVASRLCEDSGAPYLLENPVGTLSTYWRPPDHKFDPCDFAGYISNPTVEAYRKKTCLWVGGGFVMPPAKPLLPYGGSKIHTSLRSANDRSATPKGFSRAVFEANCPIASRVQSGPTGG